MALEPSFPGSEPFESPSDFCVLPWVALQLTPTGVKTCCAQDGRFSDVPQDGLKKIFNNTKAQEVRKLFSQSRIPDDCKHCVKFARTTPTYKTAKHPMWKHHSAKLLSETSPEGSVDAPVRFLDLRFSNVCNFACRTCDSFSSSRWTELDRKLGRPSFDLKRWDTDPQVMASVFEVLPEVEEIHFAGGEPFLTDGHYEVLNWLIKNGKTNVKLYYNTNLSVRNYKNFELMELWKNFKQVDVHASLDSIGAAGEYIRQGFKWSQMEENLKHFRPYIRLVHGVVSVYNIFSILEQIVWIQKNLGLDTSLFNVYSPLSMSITVLSPAVKRQVRATYESFLDIYSGQLSSFQLSGISNVLSYLESADHTELGPQFKRVNETLDRQWQKSFVEVFPLWLRGTKISRGSGVRSYEILFNFGIRNHH